MTDDDSRESKDFDERLKALREKLDDDTGSAGSGSGDKPASSSVGGRIAADFIAGIVGGALLGYVLDWWLGTSPWLLVIFLLLGFGSGVLNSYRTAKRASESGEQ